MDYINVWDINGEEFAIRDHDRGLPNGVATLDSNSKVPIAQLPAGTANGVASLDNNGRIPYSQLPESAMELRGYWNASTNTPTLADGVGTNGDLYIVSTAGTQDLGSGNITFNVDDRVLYSGGVWGNISKGEVKTVNGIAPVNGNVTLPTDDVPTKDSTNYVKSGGVYDSLKYVSPVLGTAFSNKALASQYGVAWRIPRNKSVPHIATSIKRSWKLTPTDTSFAVMNVMLNIYHNANNALVVEATRTLGEEGTVIYQTEDGYTSTYSPLIVTRIEDYVLIFSYHFEQMDNTACTIGVLILEIGDDLTDVSLVTSFVLKGDQGQNMSSPLIKKIDDTHLLVSVYDKSALFDYEQLLTIPSASELTWTIAVNTYATYGFNDRIIDGSLVGSGLFLSSSDAYTIISNVVTSVKGSSFVGPLTAMGVVCPYSQALNSVYFYIADAGAKKLWEQRLDDANPGDDILNASRWSSAYVYSEYASVELSAVYSRLFLTSSPTNQSREEAKVMIVKDITVAPVTLEANFSATARILDVKFANGVYMALAKDGVAVAVLRSFDGINFAPVYIDDSNYGDLRLEYIDDCWLLIQNNNSIYEQIKAYSDYYTLDPTINLL